jgi:hypothetical protein
MTNPSAPEKSAPVPTPKSERNEVPVPLGKGSDPDYLKDPTTRNIAPAPAETPRGPPKEGAHWPASGETEEPKWPKAESKPAPNVNPNLQRPDPKVEVKDPKTYKP